MSARYPVTAALFSYALLSSSVHARETPPAPTASEAPAKKERVRRVCAQTVDTGSLVNKRKCRTVRETPAPPAQPAAADAPAPEPAAPAVPDERRA